MSLYFILGTAFCCTPVNFRSISIAQRAAAAAGGSAHQPVFEAGSASHIPAPSRTLLARTALVPTLVAVAAAACGHVDRFPTAPLEPVNIRSVMPHSPRSNAVTVAYDADIAASVRLHYAAADGSDSGTTPWTETGTALVVLGLLPATTYALSIESRLGAEMVIGPPARYATRALPTELSGVRMNIIAGESMSHGFNLANIHAPNGQGYAVIFDSTGALRWYRRFGLEVLFETKQQPNGNFTVFQGSSLGWEPVPGAFVEITPAGDSVRAIVAAGSPYTDSHELIVTVDSRNNHLADYLFGYDIRTVDRSAHGGGESDDIAGHQVLRIGAAGRVDTLIQGWDEWGTADAVEPPLLPRDFDHPNSIDFDLDGGVIVSYRNLGTIVKVNPTTRAIVWQLGGTHNQFTFVNDPLSGFSTQHTARILPDGHLLLFDNGWHHSPRASRAVEYAIDTVAMTATLVWQYAPVPPIFTMFAGAAQRLSNGNTLITYSLQGLVDEVSPTGALVSRARLESSPGVAVATYRVTRIDNLYSYVRP